MHIWTIKGYYDNNFEVINKIEYLPFKIETVILRDNMFSILILVGMLMPF